MWLLSTSHAELHYFTGPEAVPGGYAILSHVWEGEEQTFGELRSLQKTCAETGANPRDLASTKIRRFCELAEAHGHSWGWADTCCIDKSSSSELSEAINSMYRYYSMAEVCYAYLFDVPGGDMFDGGQAGPVFSSEKLTAWDLFARSMWHKRGWTLQELIAPDVVVFVSQEWIVIGAKADLPNLLFNITGIPHEVLTLVKEPAEVSIAQRMSWAANRETTRPEDEAYSLMGIFDVNMPTLYGEGRRAFRRLQEEIMKKSVDSSIFAWHKRYSYEDELVISQVTVGAPIGRCSMDHATKVNLFAESPRDFRGASSVMYYGPSYSGFKHDNRLHLLNMSATRHPIFTITPQYVRANMLVHRAGSIVHGLLLCSDRPPQSDSSSNVILLTLVRCGESLRVTLPALPLYHAVGLRLISSFAEFGRTGQVNTQIEDIYIIHEPSRPRREHLSAVNASLFSPFRISVSALLQDVQAAGIVSVTQSKLPQPWSGSSSPLRLRFQGSHPATATVRFATDPWHFTVSLGCCTVPMKHDNSMVESRGSRWATVVRGTPTASGEHTGNLISSRTPGPSARRGDSDWQPGEPVTRTHDCAVDHIEDWTDHTKVYHDIISHRLDDGAEDLLRVGDVRLSFIPSLFPAASDVHPLELHVQIIDSIRLLVQSSDVAPSHHDRDSTRCSAGPPPGTMRTGGRDLTRSGGALTSVSSVGLHNERAAVGNPAATKPNVSSSSGSLSDSAPPVHPSRTSESGASTFGRLRRRARSLFSLSSSRDGGTEASVDAT